MIKTILITGATGALGRATAREIAGTGANVTLLARNKTSLEAVKYEITKEAGNSNIEIIVADFSEISSIKKAVKEFRQKHDRLDILVNIAAVYHNKRVATKDELEAMFAINHMGPFILTNSLLDLMKAAKPATIVSVSAPSTTKVNFDDLQGEKKFSALHAFGASKMMTLLFTYSLARKLEGTGVTANVFHPGLMKSGLTKEMPLFLRFLMSLMAKSPDKAARMLRRIGIDSEYSDTNGVFYKFTGDVIKSSDYSHDIEVQDKLWEISERIAGKAN